MNDALGRILLVTRNFPPLIGGMERLNWNLAAELSRHTPVSVIAPHGAGRQAPAGVEITEVPLRPLGRFLCAAGWQALRHALVLRPRWVLAGSGLTAPLAWAAARLSGARAAAYVHGLDLAVRHPLYRALWLRTIRRLDRLIANSHATAALAQAIGVPPLRLAIVHPGVEVPAVDRSERRRLRQSFRAEHGLGERPVLLSVGRLTTRKGLVPFVRDVLPWIVQACPHAVLVIVGDVPKDALAAEAEPPGRIMATARAAGLDKQVHWIGPKIDAELSAAYFAADVHVFPVRDIPGDPEGFGMVAIEAAAHGVPTVAYATGGVVDAVAEGVSGILVQSGDSKGFAAAVLSLLDQPLPQHAIVGWAQGFQWSSFGLRLIRALTTGSRDA